MQRRRITFAERVEARYTRRDRDTCWPWEGATFIDGRPRLNDLAVTRYIFEQEFGPVPDGYALWRDDHTEACRPATICRHTGCVNPHHLRLVRSGEGFKNPDNRKKGRDAVEGNQEDHDEPADAGRSS